MTEFYIYLAVAIVLTAIGRVVWRRNSRTVDWELVVAFIRLDFPAHQRDLAQKIAAGLAEIVGLKIKELQPEHTLGQIANWAESPVHTADLIKVLHLAYGVSCESDTSFRSLVEKVTKVQAKNSKNDDCEQGPKGSP